MCASCHELKVVTAKRMSRQRWELSVDQMVSRGATGTDEEIEQVVEYLATNFGPATVNINSANAASLVSKLGISSEEGEAIVRRRQRNGAYRNWKEVAKTPGVDGRKIERAKDQIEF
jgi:DNA uptake protein ComE-like DNA-binding protein